MCPFGIHSLLHASLAPLHIFIAALLLPLFWRFSSRLGPLEICLGATWLSGSCTRKTETWQRRARLPSVYLFPKHRLKSMWGKQSQWYFNFFSRPPMFCWIHSNVSLVKKKLAAMLTSEPDARSGWVATLHACRLLYCAAHLWNSTKLFCVHVQF